MRSPGESSMPSGTVKWFDPVKGDGFITPDDGAKDVFVHQSAVARSTFAHLREGQRVGYALEVDARGRTSAVDLSPI